MDEKFNASKLIYLFHLTWEVSKNGMYWLTLHFMHTLDFNLWVGQATILTLFWLKKVCLDELPHTHFLSPLQEKMVSKNLTR